MWFRSYEVRGRHPKSTDFSLGVHPHCQWQRILSHFLLSGSSFVLFQWQWGLSVTICEKSYYYVHWLGLKWCNFEMVLILVTVFSVDHAASFPPRLMHQFRIRIWVLNFKSCHRSRVPDITVTESSSTSSWRWISCVVQSKTNLGTKKKKHELHFPPVEPTAYHLLAGVSTVTGTRPCQWQSPCTGRLYSLTTWTAVVHDSKTRAWTSARLTSKNMKQLEGITGIYDLSRTSDI